MNPGSHPSYGYHARGSSVSVGCSAFCCRFFIICGALFSFMGITFIVIGSTTVSAFGGLSLFVVMGVGMLCIGLVMLMVGFVFCIRLRNARPQTAQPQIVGPVQIVGHPIQAGVPVQAVNYSSAAAVSPDYNQQTRYPYNANYQQPSGRSWYEPNYPDSQQSTVGSVQPRVEYHPSEPDRVILHSDWSSKDDAPPPYESVVG